MAIVEIRAMTLYVDRASQQWIVRDRVGKLWVLPVRDDPWEHRRSFEPSDETQLELMPGHYKHFLGLS
jgi:hypothetical protein